MEFRQISYKDKKMYVIYNPNSGRKVYQKDKIANFLNEHGIPHVMYCTTGEMDAFYHVKDNIDFDKCSAIAIVGGDGSTHEVVNGMLNRADKKKVPLVLLPNGSGNDYARAFHLENVDQGL